MKLIFRKDYNTETAESPERGNQLIGEGYTLVNILGEVVLSEANDERLECPYCDKTYANEQALKGHITKKHPDM